MTVLSAEQLCFDIAPHFGIKGVSLYAEQGERISIIGPNGSGKSTLLKLMTRLLKPQHGLVMLDGKDIAVMKGRDMAKALSMLTQCQPQLMEMSVGDLVQYGRQPHSSMLSGISREDRVVIEWVIRATRMETLVNRPLESLSGGERQRAWIAMALAQQPHILLLDEPTTYLDIFNQLEVLELMNQLNDQMNTTIVMVLHDINHAAQYSDRMIVMNDGSIVHHGTPHEVMTSEMFESVFRIRVRIHQGEAYPYIFPLAAV